MLMNPAFDRPSTGRQCYLAWCRRADKAGRRLPDMPVFARSNGGAGEGARNMTAIDFSAFVNELATVSGETILPFFRTALSIEDKGRHGGFDPVTAADHAAEAAMRTLIRRTFPDHGIIGEEYGKERADAEYVWVLDPIDGTKSFISGMPAWGTLIALLRSGEPVFGMMNQPFTRERFSGDGGRAHYRGPTGERDLRVRACTDLAKAVLFTTSPLLMNAHDRETFGRVEKTVRLSRYGGDCYAYCMLAAGHVDLVIETELKPYDVLPLVPIIVGAGGIITTWEGGAPHAGGRIIAAGDKRVHAAAIEVLGSR
jgi:myo-inositol-1(or 4)-monophosphatase